MKKHSAMSWLAVSAAALALPLAARGYGALEERIRGAAPGNRPEYDAKNQKKKPDSPLRGKRILFLGSSVTYGAASEGQSFVELFEALDGVEAIKEARSGTTLADITVLRAFFFYGSGASYVKRLKAISPSAAPDCVVVQLSTNDATRKLPLGEISSGTDPAAFDRKTVTGAMEWIISYCRDTWGCPVVFYTGSRYDSAEYAAMVERLRELRDKWGIGMIDLYTDEAFNAIDPETYDLYMNDPIHPTKAGYLNWWFPRMEAELTRILLGREA